MDQLNHRNDFGKFLVHHGLTGHGVEVGVAFGGYSEIILDAWPGRLHLVDPWIKQSGDVYREITNDTAPFTNWMNEAKNRLARFGDRVIFHRAFSHEAARTFFDKSLDFVYLDGNHSFDAVYEDLTNWWWKVKPGGLFAGHDYENRTDGGRWCFVKDAVDKWSKDLGLQIRTTHETEAPSWYLFR